MIEMAIKVTDMFVHALTATICYIVAWSICNTYTVDEMLIGFMGGIVAYGTGTIINYAQEE